MIARANTSYSKLEAIGRHAEQQFSKLLSNLKNTARLLHDLHDLRDLAASLPLHTEAYDVTVARVNNVMRYLESAETGAAKYEVRQLISYLRTTLDRQEAIVFEEVEAALPAVAKRMTPACPLPVAIV